MYLFHGKNKLIHWILIHRLIKSVCISSKTILSQTKKISSFTLTSIPSDSPALLLPSSKISWSPVTFSRAFAAGLPGTLLSLAVFLQHALVFPPQLVIAPHPFAVFLNVRHIRWPDELHDVLEPCARLTDLSPAVWAARHPGPVVRGRPVFECVRYARTVTGKELIHGVSLKDLKRDAGQGSTEAVLLRATDVHTFILMEEMPKQQTLIG